MRRQAALAASVAVCLLMLVACSDPRHPAAYVGRSTGPATPTTVREPEPELATLTVTSEPAPEATTVPPDTVPEPVTTTVPPVRVIVTTLPRPPPVSSGASGACGGRLPPCYVMTRESRGNPQAVNPSGCYDGNPQSAGYGTVGCFGKWQFMRATWWGLGFTGLPTDYDEAQQDEGAALLWAGGAGCRHWNAC